MSHKQTAPAGTGAMSRAWAGTRHRQVSTTNGPLSTGRPVFLRGHIVGRIVGEVFERPITTDRHILRRLNAISTHREVLDQLQGVEWLHCRDERGRDYWARSEDLQQYGIPFTDPRFGAQVALSLHHWTDRPERQSRLL